MADMKKGYDDLIIINLYHYVYYGLYSTLRDELFKYWGIANLMISSNPRCIDNMYWAKPQGKTISQKCSHYSCITDAKISNLFAKL